MTENGRSDFALPADRSAPERYGIALLLTVGGFSVTLVLLVVGGGPIYGPLLGAVLLTAWLGGLGPAVVSLTIGWALALWLLIGPYGDLELGYEEDLVRWAVNLGFGILIVVVAGILRAGRRRATEAVTEVEGSLERAEALQELSGALAAAASQVEISSALAERAASFLGAQGALLGLLENGDVLVVEATGIAAGIQMPGRRARARPEDAVLHGRA